MATMLDEGKKYNTEMSPFKLQGNLVGRGGPFKGLRGAMAPPTFFFKFIYF